MILQISLSLTKFHMTTLEQYYFEKSQTAAAFKTSDVFQLVSSLPMLDQPAKQTRSMAADI